MFLLPLLLLHLRVLLGQRVIQTGLRLYPFYSQLILHELLLHLLFLLNNICFLFKDIFPMFLGQLLLLPYLQVALL